MKRISCYFVIVILTVLLMPLSVHAAGCITQTTNCEYRDVGKTDDFVSTNNIYFDDNYASGDANYAYYWVIQGGTWYPFRENSNSFWWRTDPPSMAGMTDSRSLVLFKSGYLKIDGAGFTVDANGNPTNDLYLTIRYKDMSTAGCLFGADLYSEGYTQSSPLYCDPGVYIYAYDKNGGGVNQGYIAGLFDHRWKTKQFQISKANIAKQSDGDFMIRIGHTTSGYWSSIFGDLPIDKVKLSTTNDKSEFEADSQGYSETIPASQFTNLHNTDEYVPGEGPMFVYGAYEGTFVVDGGSATSPGYGSNDTFQQMESMGMNTFFVHDWYSWWYGHYAQYPEYTWTLPGTYTYMGFPEMLMNAKGHNIKVVPNFIYDLNTNDGILRYGDEQGALSYLTNVTKYYKNDKSILSWYIKDEWNHPDPNWANPYSYLEQLYARIAAADPDTPTSILAMWWTGSMTYNVSSKLADINMFDYYWGPSVSNPVKLETDVNNTIHYLDDMRRSSKPGMALWHVFGDGTKGERHLTSNEVLLSFYLTVIHDYDGYVFFRMRSTNDPDALPALPGNYQDVNDGLTQIGRELFGPNGISFVYLTPSVLLDLNGEKGVVSSTNKFIQYIYKQDKFGNKWLVTANSKDSAQSTTFSIPSLSSGTVITVLFEGRTITSGSNTLADTYSNYQRHVYMIKAASPPACTDNDGDGYGDPWSTSCTYFKLDCDDNNANIHPFAAEIQGNNIDEDCNGFDLPVAGGCSNGAILTTCSCGGSTYHSGDGYCCSNVFSSSACPCTAGDTLNCLTMDGCSGTQSCVSGTWGSCLDNNPTDGCPSNLVTIRENVNSYNDTEDTSLKASSPTSNFGTVVLTPDNGGTSPTKVVIIKFNNLGYLQQRGTVVNATLTFEKNWYGSTGYTGVFKAYRIMQPWKEMEATAVQRLTGVNWKGQLASSASDTDSTADRKATPDATTTAVITTVWDHQKIILQLNPATVQSWITNPSTNYGELITVENQNSGQGATIDFNDRNSAYNGYVAPQLDLVFSTTPSNCTLVADADCNGCIDMSELATKISGWRIGSVPISTCIQSIKEWKAKSC
jgi:hypothetical protein